MYIDVFFLVCFICVGVRIVSNVYSGFCCISMVVQVGAQPVVPLVAKDSTERLERWDSGLNVPHWVNTENVCYIFLFITQVTGWDNWKKSLARCMPLWCNEGGRAGVRNDGWVNRGQRPAQWWVNRSYAQKQWWVDGWRGAAGNILNDWPEAGHKTWTDDERKVFDLRLFVTA